MLPLDFAGNGNSRVAFLPIRQLDDNDYSGCIFPNGIKLLKLPDFRGFSRFQLALKQLLWAAIMPAQLLGEMRDGFGKE